MKRGEAFVARWAATVAAGVLVAGLSGCIAPTVSIDGTQTATTHGATPQPTTSRTPTATQLQTPTPRDLRASVAPGNVGCFPVEVPLDNGPRKYAMGTATTDSSGVPISYKVASGDVIDYIADRFGFFNPCPRAGLGFAYLNTINQVRRGGYPWPLYAGDTLNLSAYKITSVGTINGQVKHEAAPDPMPQQK